MRAHPIWLSASLLVSVAGCSGASTESGLGLKKAPPISAPRVEAEAEVHLADVRQLTFGGENAEAYWAFGGDQLVLQARLGDAGCDRIYRMKLDDPKNLLPVSSGKGATTCSYFLPGDEDVIYASTHLGGESCPPKPDMRQGYVWALYDTYDIFRAKADGSGVTRLTETPGYDAEGTVCKKDGSIVFTSVRDGDLELYRMDADGKNVKRLTSTPGYDGGAFFNEDCSKIVWRASRPKGKALEEYRALLGQNLVRPTKLELFVANADGSDPVQVTSLGAASFAPYFFPGSKRIIFSSNHGDPRGREFDIWAINVDGTELERITSSPGFDGFPMFSPDGKTLAFSSNRATMPGKSDTNVFVARWLDTPPRAVPTAADRVAADVRFLADPGREGRGVGTKGLVAAGEHIEKRFAALGLEPAGTKGFRQGFPVPTSVKAEATVEIDGKPVPGARALSFSANADALEAGVVFAGYGIVSKTRDDYKGLDVKDKVVLVRRFTPEGGEFEDAKERRRHGDLRRKAWLARDKGAKAILVVDAPERPKTPVAWKVPEEAKMPSPSLEGFGDAGLAAAILPRSAGGPLVDRLARKQTARAKVTTKVAFETTEAFNVLGRIRAPEANKLPGVVVVGAHYDHLGLGGHGSLAPDKTEVHPGADDNASGTAALLEVARLLAADKASLRRDVVIAAFSGEERGVLGSSFLVKEPPPGLAAKDIHAMINLDMVGRVGAGKVDVIAWDTATEWPSLLEPACDAARLTCAQSAGGGYGPSDHSPFYGAGVPVLFFFSGVHSDYHKPSDTPDKIHFAGVAQVATAAASVARATSAREGKLSYQAVPSPPPNGDVRSFGASLGTIPDYAPPPGTKGMLLAGVRPGGAADKAGLTRGDVIVRIGDHPIGGVEDLMYVLTDSKPGQKAKIVVMRDGKEVVVEAVFQGAKAH